MNVNGIAYMDLPEKSKRVKQWLIHTGVKEKTVENYLLGLSQYLVYTGKTPDELIDEAKAEAKDSVDMCDRGVVLYRDGFRDMLEKSGYAPCTIKNYMNCVNSFYESMYIDIPRSRARGKHRSSPRAKKENVRPISKETIQDILPYCDPLEKAIVLVGVSSGLAEADIMNLKISDYRNGYDPVTKITMLHLIRVKSEVEFTTFLTPEATEAVDEYLKFRNKQPQPRDTGLRRQQLEKQRVTRDDGYLFVQKHISDDYLDIKKDEKGKRTEKYDAWHARYQQLITCENRIQWQRREDLRKWTEDGFQQLYTRLSDNAQKSDGIGRKIVRSHNMRRYFSTTLQNEIIPGVDFFTLEHLLGHQLDPVRETYYLNNPNKLKEKYKLCVPYLTIRDPTNIAESIEYQKMAANNEKLTAEMEQMIRDRDDIKDLKLLFGDEIQRLQDRIKHPKTEADKIILEHRRQLATDLVYRAEYEAAVTRG